MIVKTATLLSFNWYSVLMTRAQAETFEEYINSPGQDLIKGDASVKENLWKEEGRRTYFVEVVNFGEKTTYSDYSDCCSMMNEIDSQRDG